MQGYKSFIKQECRSKNVTMLHMLNPLVTAEQLAKRITSGPLPSELNDIILYQLQCLTQAAGVLLELPQSVTAQANVVIARYWMVAEPLEYEFNVRIDHVGMTLDHANSTQEVSAAAVFLVAKLGPIPQSPRSIANVYGYLLSPGSIFICNRTLAPPENDPESYYRSDSDYQSFHTRVLAAEARILHYLSFDTHVALPHPLVVTYLQALEFLSMPKEPISQRALQYLNTALLSPQLLYLTHQPHALAVAAIYSAARDVGSKMPECAWWEIFDVDREELGFLVVGMRSLEGWLRRQKHELPALWYGGMITRQAVKEEMMKRGLTANGNGATEDVDEEARMMREMDKRAELTEDIA